MMLAIEQAHAHVEYWRRKNDRLLALLKLIAETPESRDTIQVWAWQAYKREVPDA